MNQGGAWLRRQGGAWQIKELCRLGSQREAWQVRELGRSLVRELEGSLVLEIRGWSLLGQGARGKLGQTDRGSLIWEQGEILVKELQGEACLRSQGELSSLMRAKGEIRRLGSKRGEGYEGRGAWQIQDLDGSMVV